MTQKKAFTYNYHLIIIREGLERPPTLYTNLVFSYNEVRRTRYREWYTCTFSKLKKIPDSVLEQGEQQKSEKPANYWFFYCRILCCLSYIIMIHNSIQFECFYQPNMCNARQSQLIIQSIKIVCMIHNSNKLFTGCPVRNDNVSWWIQNTYKPNIFNMVFY